MKCKTKREMLEPQAEFTSTGTPGTRGTCPVCGTTMFRMGNTPAHDGMVPPERPARKKKDVVRSGKLVIVESPAKARTVGRYLGDGYTVEASVGHVRDLLRSQLSVDVEDGFAPKYRVPNEKRLVVKELKKQALKAEQIYLATDPDREGEAIAWHLIEAAEIDPALTRRVVFHEITKPAIEEAFSHPREINMDLVDAQQARRILDRLVGYTLSPILWDKVRNRLSAGRVQSVAMRLVVEREREIDDFMPEEYWSIEAELKPERGEGTFVAKLAEVDGEQPELGSESVVLPLVEDLQSAAYVIDEIKRGQRRRKPRAPFTTSTMQQESSRKLNFTARKAMSVAQQLYEGIDLGEGESMGLITYMRTDSTNVSSLAQQEVRDYVKEVHGQSFLPEEPPVYSARAKAAQEAHEAVRPTSVRRTPKQLKEHLSRDQYRLYQLIWQRFVASQMLPALYDTVSVRVNAQGQAHLYGLRASGSVLKFPGYLVVYTESEQESGEDDEKNAAIPDTLEEGQRQELLQLLPEQHFTQPPPRFSEATLVKSLEEYGIGRPSTYAPTINTLQQRGYVYREGRRLFPTETAMLVNDLLVEHFPGIVDINFTAEMEADLDKIASGEEEWVDVVREFYTPFSEEVERAKVEMPETKSEPEYIGRICPTCEEGQLLIKWGRYGKFIGCANFPDCRHTEPWLEKIGVTCPLDGGDLVERRTRKGRTFYGCANYPECEFTSWKKPLPNPCPNCSGTLVIANKNFAQCLDCETQYRLTNFETEEAIEESV
ncbi:MAG: type I DNA topoisomerase [Chloroflexi bacterium]|nr:type I DNA topoisomerase [Chloroflexota bacterium]